MRTRFIFAVFILLVVACKPSEDYKIVRKQVVEEHDHVMLDSERAIKNRMKLDTILSKLDSFKKLDSRLDIIKEKRDIQRIGKSLDSADHAMETWMKEFDAELGKKSNDEAVKYFQNEKEKLRRLDTLFKTTLKESGDYLRKY